MSKLSYSILFMAGIWIMVIGAGIYVMRTKAKDLDRVERAEKVARLKMAELEELFLQETRSAEAARMATQRWFARYKVIPEELESYEVLSYLNSLSASGFKNFDVTSNGSRSEADYSYQSYSIDGRGYFSSLYRFVWHIENNRNFYRIDDLTLDQIDLVTEDRKTNKPRLEVMVSFHMNVNAYYSGTEGVSAPEDLFASLVEGEGLPDGWSSNLPPVPKDILPDQATAVNPFYPGILKQIPPNAENLVELEEGGADLISIAGGKAFFYDEQGYRALGVGDPVYLGQITGIDPVNGKVSARLNKGGIIDYVELELNAESQSYRQAMGNTLLTPSNQQ